MVMTVKKISTSLVILGTLAVAACGQGGDAGAGPDGSGNAGTPQPNSAASMPAMNGGGQAAQATGEVHSGNGDITEIADGRVTISHGPVETIGWPAMTMRFRTDSPEMVQGLSVGDPVNFQFRQAGEEYVLTSISRVQQ